MRLLLLLFLVGAAAYLTNPKQTAFETAAHAALQDYHPTDNTQAFSLDDVIGYAKGVFAGQGRYENYYVAGRYTIDMPGPDYLQCIGAFTVVKCQVQRS